VPHRARCDVQIGHRTLELAFHLELGRAERVPPRPLGLELGLQMRTSAGWAGPWLPITLCAVCLALSVTPSALLPLSVRLCALSVPQSPFGPYPGREGFSHTYLCGVHELGRAAQARPQLRLLVRALRVCRPQRGHRRLQLRQLRRESVSARRESADTAHARHEAANARAAQRVRL